jgi:acyl-CoA reductase-like NAD-dependent aldehyde dehydrogenase
VFAGNAAVVKVSEWATASRQRFDGVFRQLLARRGWSPDLVQLLPGYGDTGAALCRSPRVGKILFIGSPATGKRVMSAASAQLTPVVLELGGKDPFIVLPDAEFDHAVEVALRGVFINNGQNCLAAERLYIHRSIYDKFREEILRRARELRLGVPPCLRAAGDEQGEGQVDCGAMTMPGQVEIVASLVSDALDRGARLLLGGISRLPSEQEGEERHRLFFPPTILADVTHEMRIVNEEAFGPVMLLIPFDSDAQLVEMANGTGYGLGGSIFSTDYARAERIGKQISSGMLTINDFGLGYLIQSLPFGGCKVCTFALTKAL